MKKLVILALTLAVPAIADSYVVIGLPAVSCNSVIGVELLYWKPCHQRVDYAVFEEFFNDTQIFQSEMFFLNPDYQWGFRLFGGISDQCHCNFASLEWARVHGSTSITLQRPNLEGTLKQQPLDIAFQRVLAREQTGYDKVVLSFGHRFCHNLYAYVGGRYAQASYRLSSRGVDPVQAGNIADSIWFTKFTGGGLEAGLSVACEVGCGFGLCARVGAFGLISKKRLKVREEISQAGTARIVDKVATSGRRCVGGYELRLGLNYTYECGCYCFSGEVGYEYNQYLGAFLLRQPSRSQGSLTTPVVTDANFGIGGLYVGCMVGF